MTHLAIGPGIGLRHVEGVFSDDVQLVLITEKGDERIIAVFSRQNICTCGAWQWEDPESYDGHFNCTCPHDDLPETVAEAIALLKTQRYALEAVKAYHKAGGKNLFVNLKYATRALEGHQNEQE